MKKKVREQRHNPGFATRMLEFCAGLAEFINGGDRVSAVLGAARLDVALERILLGLFSAKERAQKELFGSERGLSSLSVKIDLAYHMGLITENLQKTLHLVRKIRNDAAHDHYPFRLDSDEQRDRVNELKRLTSSPSFDFSQISKELKLSDFQGEALDFRVVLCVLSFQLEGMIHALACREVNVGKLLNEEDLLKCPVEVGQSVAPARNQK